VLQTAEVKVPVVGQTVPQLTSDGQPVSTDCGGFPPTMARRVDGASRAFCRRI